MMAPRNPSRAILLADIIHCPRSFGQKYTLERILYVSVAFFAGMVYPSNGEADTSIQPANPGPQSVARY